MPSTPPVSSLPTLTSPDTLRGQGNPKSRTPPGQTLTSKWPVLHYGSVPHINPAQWSLRVWGLVENPITLDWNQFNALPKANLRCDIHCVTHWSRLDNLFTGVPIKTILALAKPLPTAKYVIEHAASDPDQSWTTNLPLHEFNDDDCLLATHHDNHPLSPDHGGPVRAIVPRLYFWKGAKWITGIELVAKDKPGFWEINGYHMHGNPWKEERFGW